MRLFKPRNLYAVYVPEIDAEHRTLVRFGDEFHQAVLQGAGSDRLLPLLRELIACSEDHFSHEERLMHDSGYPAQVWHKQQHDGARKRLGQFAERIAAGDSEAPLLLLEYLSGWLRDHTGLTDRMFGAYLRNFERLHAAMAS